MRKQETAINKQSNSITRQTFQLFSNLILTWSLDRRSRLLSSILQPGSYPINPKRSSIRPYRLIPQPRVKPAPGESIANRINDLLYNGLMESSSKLVCIWRIYTNRWPKRKESAISLDISLPGGRSLELLISSVIEDRKVILCWSSRHLRIHRVFILIFLFSFCLDCLFLARSLPFSFSSLFPLWEIVLGGTRRRRERSLGAVILFTRSWASLLIEDSTLVIFARFERRWKKVCARSVDCALWFRLGDDCGAVDDRTL